MSNEYTTNEWLGKILLSIEKEEFRSKIHEHGTSFNMRGFLFLESSYEIDGYRNRKKERVIWHH